MNKALIEKEAKQIVSKKTTSASNLIQTAKETLSNMEYIVKNGAKFSEYIPEQLVTKFEKSLKNLNSFFDDLKKEYLGI